MKYFVLEMKIWVLVAFVLGLVLMNVTTSYAVTKTSTGSGNWGTAGTWSPSGVPASGDDVIIASGHTVTVNGVFTCSTLQINGGGNTTAELAFAGSGNPSLTVAGAVTVGHSGHSNREGTITFTNGSTLVAGSLSLGAVDSQTSLIDMTSGGKLTINGTITVFTNSTWTPGSGTLELTANNTLPATIFTSFNNLLITSGTTTSGRNFSITGTMTVNGTFTPGATTHVFSGAGTLNGSGFVKVTLISATAFSTQYSMTTRTISSMTVDYSGSGNQTVQSLTYNNLALSNSGTKTFSAALTINGNLSIAGTAALTCANNTNSTASTLSLGGYEQNSGTWGGTGSGATNINTTYFNASTNGKVTISSGSCTTGIWLGTTSTDWNTASNWCGGIPTLSTNVVIFSGTAFQPTIGAAGGLCNNLTINSGATLTISGSNSLTLNGVWTNNGSFTPNTSTVIFNGTTQAINGNATSFRNITIKSTSTTTANVAPTIHASGTFTIENSSTYIHNYTTAASTTIFAGTESFGASSNVRIDNWTSTSTVLTTGVSLPFGNLELNWTSGGTWSQQLSGTISYTAGNFIITTLGSEFRLTAATTGTALTLSIGGNLSVVSGTLSLVGGGSNGSKVCTVNVNGDVDISGTGAIDMSSSSTTSGAVALNIGGNFSVAGSGILRSTTGAGTRTVNFNNASGNQTFTATAGGINTSAITFNVGTGSSSNTLQLLSNFVMNNTASLNVLNNAALNCGTNIVQATVANTQGNFTLNSGGTLLLGSTAGITSSGATGNIQTATTRSFSTGANYTYNNSAPSAQVTGNGLPATVNGLKVDNAAGVSLSGAVTINGTLDLTNGLLIPGSNNLTAAATASIVNASSSSYVSGKLNRVYNATGSKTFPIGKSSNFRPLTLNYTALTGTSTVSVEQFESTIAGSIPVGVTAQTGRYWDISQTGGSAFTYSLTLDGTPFTPGINDPVILKGDGVTNTALTASYSNPNFTATGITSFSNFAVGSSQKNCPVSTAVTPAADQTVCQGVATNQLTATITTSGGTGNPTFLYQWYYNLTNSNTVAGATLISGATNQTYTPLSGPSEAGTTRYYFCVGYATNNGCGQSNADQSLASNTVKVTVNTLPTANAGSALSAICQGGTSAALGGSVGGSATGGTWSDGGVGGTFTPSSTDLNATWTPPGAYSGTATLTLTTSGGSCGTAMASKTQVVNARPTAGTCTPVGDYCYTNSGTVDVQASGGASPYNVNWTPAHGISQPVVIIASGGIVTISGLQASTTYTFTIIDSNNCQAP
jgi:hypothetical protein